ncbi:MAG: HEPN domain-containing protein [Candidatus Nanoarchaeia archaeon]|nr:HEPN domain-containing protein [Candidatus Nanoarchaeia archaeon]
MKKIFDEEKLQIINPNEEIKDSYVKKSESNLISAKILLKENRLKESVSLIYYSMYHMLIALLFRTGIKCKNHSASIILLKELFSIDNSDIIFAKKERLDKQYYTSFKIAKKEVIESVKTAENFNKKLFDFISKLNNEEIKEYQEKIKKII